MNPHQTFFLPHFLGKPTNFSYLIFLEKPPIFSTSFSWETHQFFLPHFFGKPTNFSYLIFLGNPPIFSTSFFWESHQFSYLIFLGNPPIFPTSFSWKTHQFFLPHFLGKPTNLINETLKETPSYEVFDDYLCYHLEFLQAFHNEGRYH